MKDKIETFLKNFRSYRYAVNQYEKHKPLAQAGVANYDGMPSGAGAPELFFAQVGKMADMGNKTSADRRDYETYKRAVETIEGALDTLNDDERSIVRLKWMDNLTLQEIADRKQLSFSTVRRHHRNAMSQLKICFRFIEPPHIEEIPTRGSVHYHHETKMNNRVSQFMHDL